MLITLRLPEVKGFGLFPFMVLDLKVYYELSQTTGLRALQFMPLLAKHFIKQQLTVVIIVD